MKCENINHAAHKNDFKMQEISLNISEARKKYTLEKWFIFSRFALDANTRPTILDHEYSNTGTLFKS